MIVARDSLNNRPCRGDTEAANRLTAPEGFDPQKRTFTTNVSQVELGEISVVLK
jgi:hypothetical protein